MTQRVLPHEASGSLIVNESHLVQYSWTEDYAENLRALVFQRCARRELDLFPTLINAKINEQANETLFQNFLICKFWSLQQGM